VSFRLGSWWEPWRGEAFDIVVCNPPYVAERDPHLEALRHEPRDALVSEEDGLAALRAVVRAAPPHLRPGGSIWLEHGFEQQDAVAALLEGAGFSRIERHHDLAGRPRCTGGIL
jgi:release factor glutamine methyltransferase